MLITGWDPDIVIDKRGSTALMWAAGGGHLDIVKLLFKYVCIFIIYVPTISPLQLAPLPL